MADPFHHAQSSVKKWGGEIRDYLPIHNWFDETKRHFSDPRHRALRHHSEGIGLMIDIFGPVIRKSDGGTVPTRWIGEQHVLEDFGRIPTAADFLRCMTVEAWMVKGARKLSVELERDALREPKIGDVPVADIDEALRRYEPPDKYVPSARARAIGQEAVETEEEMERINEAQREPTRLNEFLDAVIPTLEES